MMEWRIQGKGGKQSPVTSLHHHSQLDRVLDTLKENYFRVLKKPFFIEKAIHLVKGKQEVMRVRRE